MVLLQYCDPPMILLTLRRLLSLPFSSSLFSRLVLSERVLHPASLERLIRKEGRASSIDNNPCSSLDSRQPPSTQAPISRRPTFAHHRRPKRPSHVDRHLPSDIDRYFSQNIDRYFSQNIDRY
ncbi:hypothetical protein F2Q69_00023172 [Brassica cretica]|uniref:Uncharacterized protein n=1 Tax=Brassica cretica TaxID=69181 RepID=A0A8S9QDG2_BRACR|nr:hypothetical protein F2Q69_00023172 [Brassica cretica]